MGHWLNLGIAPSCYMTLSIMISLRTFTRFPVWPFLNQPVFSPRRKLILNPHQFWRVYQISLFERCLLLKIESTDVPHEQ